MEQAFVGLDLGVLEGVLKMGKFPIADRKVASTLVCKKCKARNPKNAVVCRKCFYPNLRAKRARKKEGKGGK